MRFALFGNNFQEKKSIAVVRLLEALAAHGAEVYVDKEYYDFLSTIETAVNTALRMENCVCGTHCNDVDVAISIGGDGTFLRVASLIGNSDTPILGINTGRLGFLSAISPDEIEDAIAKIHAGEMDIEERITLTVSGLDSDAEQCTALNEIAILKRDSSAMIGIHVSVESELLTTYQADGLIIATPTGSTAYSLSNGGPIVSPEANTVLLTPVAPHSLYSRPLLIPDSKTLTIKIDSRSHNYLVAIDGRNHTCSDTAQLTITRGAHTIKIMKRKEQTFFSTLRKKLGWDTDPRS